MMDQKTFNTTTVYVEEANVSMGEHKQPIFLIKQELYEKVSFHINVIITPIICFFGLIGNALGVGVLWTSSRRQKLTVYIYMCTLTTCDALYLFFGLLRSIPHVVRTYDAYRANFFEEYMKLGTIFIDVVLTYTSTHLVIVVAAERLIALLKPFTVKDSILTKYPRSIILSIIVINILFFFPFPLSFEVSSYTNLENRTEYFLEFKLGYEFFMEQYFFIQTILYNYIPAVVLLVINISIPIAYYKAFKGRGTDLNMADMAVAQGNRQIKITLMVMCITVMYLLFSMTDLFIKTLGFIDSDYSFRGRYKLVFWFFTDVVNVLMYLNAANDFIIYILVSDHYRHILVRMYCACFYRRKASFSQYSQELFTGATIRHFSAES